MSSPRFARCQRCDKGLTEFCMCTFCSTAFCSAECLWAHHLAEHDDIDEVEANEVRPGYRIDERSGR